MKAARPVPAHILTLSQSTDAVIVPDRAVLLVRGRDTTRLSWAEFAKLVAYAKEQDA